MALVNLYHAREKQQNGLVHHIDEKCVTADKVEWGDVGVMAQSEYPRSLNHEAMEVPARYMNTKGMSG